MLHGIIDTPARAAALNMDIPLYQQVVAVRLADEERRLFDLGERNNQPFVPIKFNV
ncbi:hypothetical protein [Arthrobacter sp. B6]|uniref:hypothetical protein n=1 Tax=Arthrobacter sp. B6 TaxID=1570137 RepID=UPI0012E894F7|nr:hypothetical protein [Arthrobacter sp. B6]